MIKIISTFSLLVLGDEVCYESVGCFTNEPPFSVPGYRPPKLPDSPGKIDTKFYLTNHRVRDQELNWNDVDITNFELESDLFVLTHGWWDGYFTNSWMTNARRAIQSQTRNNFIAVDWRKGARHADYNLAGTNTQVVGREIAVLIKDFLLKAAFRPRKVHCVGHSLGAHACSYAGKYLQTQYGITIGRITGLDAAGPLFENCTEEVRIAKSDADFVDGIHTNGGDEREGFCGMHMAYGHADFYPNGGGRQTGCSTLDAQCHHMRATELFVDSIYDKSCEFQDCPSKNDYEMGNCSNQNRNTMGYYAIKPEKDATFFGETSDQSPFCG